MSEQNFWNDAYKTITYSLQKEAKHEKIVKKVQQDNLKKLARVENKRVEKLLKSIGK